MRRILIFLFLASIVFTAKSQWSNNPSVNNLVSNKSGSDYNGIAVTDGANGTINFFEDFSDGNIYAQHMTSAGMVAWGSSSNPLSICVSTGQKYDVSAIADGAGGAFVAWSDYRHDDEIAEIYIQKISAAGAGRQRARSVRLHRRNDRSLRDARAPSTVRDRRNLKET